MVESQCFHVFQSDPASLVIVQILIQRTVYLHHRQICNGNNTLHFWLHSSFQPTYIFRITRSVFRTKCFKLHQIHIFKSCQFIQNSLCSFIQGFIHIDKTSGKFHIMIYFSIILTCTFYKQHFQLFSVKTNHYTVYWYMIVC